MPKPELYLFGSPRLEQGGVLLELQRRKAMALLAYLALQPQRHGREAVATLLWPTFTPREGRADLSRTLSVLNKLLGPGWSDVDRETVSLNPQADLWVDVLHFEQLLEATHSHDHQELEVCLDCLPRLMEAVALYQGDFMAGFSLPDSLAFDEWQLLKSERLRRQLAGALEQLGQWYGNQGNSQQAIEYTQRWVALDPLNEAAHRQLMSLFAQSGQRAVALAHYKSCRKHLMEELGVEPSAETRSVFQNIRDSEKRSIPKRSQLIRGYEFKEQIATGGFGAVYRAWQSAVGREVAIKVILPQYANDPQFVRRFENEAQLVARLEHPSIVPLYDYWREPDGAYLVMRWLRGGSLQQALAKGPWELEAVSRLLGQVAAGLAAAHKHGVVHRDIKPANILLDEERNAYLSDFGFAKDLVADANLTQSGGFIGSPAYMSPEQIRGERVTPQSDLYSLGLVIYELLAGDSPFGPSSPATLIYKHLNEPMPLVQEKRPELPAAVDVVIHRATAKDANKRYADALALATAFGEAVNPSPLVDVLAVSDGASTGMSMVNLPAFLQLPASDLGREQPLFVARERELAQLDQHLQAALSGKGRIVLVTGEAGRGKTALLGEFARRSQQHHPQLVVVNGNCNAFSGVGDPYLPFRDILAMFGGDLEAKWAAGSIGQEQAHRLWTLLPQTIRALVYEGPDLIDVFISGPSLMDRAASAISKERKLLQLLEKLVKRDRARFADLEQRQILEQYTGVLQALSNHQPLLLILDDLQWADNASVSLLFHLVRRILGSQILILGAYRPSEVTLGQASTEAPSSRQSGFELAVNEFKRDFGDIQIDLGKTILAEGREFVDELLDSDPNQLDETFRSKLFWRTKGHPLFTIELLRDMQERGDVILDEHGQWVEGPGLAWERLPVRVEAVIEQRMGRLQGELRDILTVASVEGEDFTAEVIAAVRGLDERNLVRRLSGELDRKHGLVAAQGIRRLYNQRISLYRFQHILFQQYLYDNLDEVERTYLHEEMGYWLEKLYADQVEEIAVQLARHFQEAGILEKAVDYLLQAGNRAIRLSAHAEAIAHLTRGLELLHSLPESPERDRKELALQLALGVPLQVTMGPGATEVGKAYSRARELYQQAGQSSQLYPALWGLWRFYRSRADFQTARELADDLLSLTQKQGDPALILQGHHAQWTTLIYLGGFDSAMDHIEQGLALYSPQRHHSDASLFSGHDLGVCAHTMAAYALWMLGFPEQALERANAALALAKDFSHPPSYALAYEHLAGLHRFRKEPLAAQARAQDLISVATEQESAYDLATGKVLLGWALVNQGHVEEGLEHIHNGLAARRPEGSGLEDAHFLAVLAEAIGYAGRIEEAIDLLNQLLAAVEESDQRFWEAELHRLKGEYLIQQASSIDQAEASFRQAINVARRQNARSLELRATLDLAKLQLDQGSGDDGRKSLAELYGWFSEGFNLPDLRAAGEMLA